MNTKGIPQGIGALHFIGIGGIGMSGIAEILNTLGYTVQGSDAKDGANVQRLAASGIRVHVGHTPDNIRDSGGNLPAAVVISSAVKNDNPEVVAARAAKVPVIRRAEMLGELMRLKRAIAISGTHGKTTTTSMVGQMLESAGFDPTVINGGIVHAYGTNTRMGGSEWMAVEADESDGTFTRLPATVAVVTNIDPEHMEHYGDFENVRAAYRQFVMNLPFYGYAVLCIDHPEVQALIPSVSDRRVITYGFSPQADVRAVNIRGDATGSLFDVVFAPRRSQDREEVVKDIRLPMPGRHNVQNSLAALSIAHEMGVTAEAMKTALMSFSGVKRRFTRTGEAGGITVIDDYAHHPVEIETVLKTARVAVQESGGNIIAVMQPHRYTRLHSLFDQFCTCFNEADTVLVADIYAAGEEPITGASRDALVEGMRKHGHRGVAVLESREALAQTIAKVARPGDYVICMGAGDITAWAYALPGELSGLLGQSRGSAA